MAMEFIAAYIIVGARRSECCTLSALRFILINPVTATRHSERHPKKVEVKGLGRNISYVTIHSLYT